MHRGIAREILENEIFDSREIYNKSICEIKMFFWAYGSKLYKNSLSSKLYKRTSNFFLTDVAFTSFNNYEYSLKELNRILDNRLEFYSKGQTIKDKNKLDEFYSIVYKLWFSEPLKDLDYINASLNISESLEHSIKVKSFYDNYMPIYMQSLEELLHIINNQKLNRRSFF